MSELNDEQLARILADAKAGRSSGLGRTIGGAGGGATGRAFDGYDLMDTIDAARAVIADLEAERDALRTTIVAALAELQGDRPGAAELILATPVTAEEVAAIQSVVAERDELRKLLAKKES